MSQCLKGQCIQQISGGRHFKSMLNQAGQLLCLFDSGVQSSTC